MKAGDSNRITREYFDSLLIEMRHIDAVVPDTAKIDPAVIIAPRA
jgi:hypothetical protein